MTNGKTAKKNRRQLSAVLGILVRGTGIEPVASTV